MGRMKDLFIEQMNQEKAKEPLNYGYIGDTEPWPDEIDVETGKCMWIIRESKVWANTYAEALDLYSMIEQQPNENHEEI
jgi:hypothetical protein